MRILLLLDGSAAAIAAALANIPESLTASGVTDVLQALDGPMPVPTFTPPMPVMSSDGEDDGPMNAAPPATDATGMPWDERIHANTKGQNEDGTWRKKRKVDAALVAAVEAERRGGAVAAPAPVPAPVPMPQGIPMVAAMPAPAPVAAMPAAVPMPAPIPAPVTPVPAPAQIPVAAPAPAPVAVDPASVDFTGFMAHLTGRMQTQQITSDDLIALVQQVNAAYTPHGHAPLGAITDLQQDQQKLTYAVQVLQHQGKW